MTETLTLAEEARQLKNLKEVAKGRKALHDAAKKDVAEAELALMERMEGEEVTSIGTGGTMFVRAETIYGAIADRAAFVEWAQANDTGLLKTVERADLINALARKCLDDDEDFPPGLNYSVKPYISQRAQASSVTED
jgi:hypothetical protein